MLAAFVAAAVCGTALAGSVVAADGAQRKSIMRIEGEQSAPVSDAAPSIVQVAAGKPAPAVDGWKAASKDRASAAAAAPSGALLQWTSREVIRGNEDPAPLAEAAIEAARPIGRAKLRREVLRVSGESDEPEVDRPRRPTRRAASIDEQSDDLSARPMRSALRSNRAGEYANHAANDSRWTAQKRQKVTTIEARPHAAAEESEADSLDGAELVAQNKREAAPLDEPKGKHEQDSTQDADHTAKPNADVDSAEEPAPRPKRAAAPNDEPSDAGPPKSLHPDERPLPPSTDEMPTHATEPGTVRPQTQDADTDCRKNKAECEEGFRRMRANTIDRVSIDIALAGKEGVDYPCQCPFEGGAFQGRCWQETVFSWKAAATCHRPLYFEDVHLERYGHAWCPAAQPFVSAAHFFVSIPLLPYKMGTYPPDECVYSLGYYRPGNCAPYLIDASPLSMRGGLLEAAAAVGIIFIIP